MTLCLPWESLTGCVFSAGDILRPKKQLCVRIVFLKYELRPEKLLSIMNATQHSRRTVKDEINAQFLLRTKKQPMKESIENTLILL